MDDRLDIFAPLGNADPDLDQGASGQSRPDEWQSIVPAPEEPPETPPGRRRGRDGRWVYRDAAGRPLFAVFRFLRAGGGKDILPLSYGTLNGQLGWHWKAIPAPRPLYGLDRLAARTEAPLLIVEGEKTAEAAALIFPDHAAVTWPGGARAVNKADWSPLAGRAVTVWPDNDEAGRDAAVAIAATALRAGAYSAAVVQVPTGWPDGWDLADPRPDGVAAEALLDLLTAAKPQVAEHPDPGPAMPAGYVLKQGGVYLRYPDSDKPDLYVCGPLVVRAATNDGTGRDWGALLTWSDKDGREHEWAMPLAMLAGDGTEVRAHLLSRGLTLGTARGARDALSAYLMRSAPARRVRIVGRMGWHDVGTAPVFVLPDRTLGGTDAQRTMLQTERPDALPPIAQSGSLAEWQGRVAAPCRGNSRLILALSAAFGGPLLHLLNAESGGFHLRGASSTGKTTALVVAGSVWGGGGISGWSRRWRATDNALESIAGAHCDLLLCLDEMGEAAPEAIAATAYMLANGGGKSRASRDGSGRRMSEWRLLFLSTGEVGLADVLAQGRGGPLRARAGQEVRIVDVPADAGAGLGMFSDCRGAAPNTFAETLRASARRLYGCAGLAFLEALTGDPERHRSRAGEIRAAFVAANLPKGASGQVARVLDRFALLAAAGELAIGMGILPWARGEAEAGIAACFRAWLGAREGKHGAAEDAAAIAAVRHFIGAHDARFERIEPSRDDDDDRFQPRPVVNRAGWKRSDGASSRYLILPETWRREVLAGMDPVAAAAALYRVGHLVPQAAGRWQRSERVPDHEKPVRVYAVHGSILAGEGGEG